MGPLFVQSGEPRRKSVREHFFIYFILRICERRYIGAVRDLARVLRLFFRHAPLGGKLLASHARKTSATRTAAAKTRPSTFVLFYFPVEILTSSF